MNYEELNKLFEIKNYDKLIENIPNISYSPRPPGWNDIFKGLLSPHAREYKTYLLPVIQKLKHEKREGKNSQNIMVYIFNYLFETS